MNTVQRQGEPIVITPVDRQMLLRHRIDPGDPPFLVMKEGRGKSRV
jgi:hypothetical protein